MLRNNHESIVYGDKMLQALENMRTDPNAVDLFRESLKGQQGNITEVGEKEATDELTRGFSEWLAHPADSVNYPTIRRSIYKISRN